jgi:hypothetical protein
MTGQFWSAFSCQFSVVSFQLSVVRSWGPLRPSKSSPLPLGGEGGSPPAFFSRGGPGEGVINLTFARSVPFVVEFLHGSNSPISSEPDL